MKTENLAIATESSYISSGFLWTGEDYPKLIDRETKAECDMLEALADEYLSNTNLWKSHQQLLAAIDEIEPYQRRAAYCKKRYAKITRDRFQPGTKVTIGSELGVVEPYADKATAYLQKVKIKLVNSSVVQRYPTEIDLADVPPKRARVLDFCARKSDTQTIAIADIKRNGGTQQRIAINHETVKEYSEAMRDGDRFPPVKLMFDGKNYWLTDGFHTIEAAWSIGKTEIEAEVTEGTQRDAILVSVAVNAEHGLRRSNADKRKAVTTLLEDPEWSQWSNREIARKCKVSESLVRTLRNEINSMRVNVAPRENSNDDNSESLRLNAVRFKNKHGNISEMDVSNIGKSNAAPRVQSRGALAPDLLRRHEAARSASVVAAPSEQTALAGRKPEASHDQEAKLPQSVHGRTGAKRLHSNLADLLVNETVGSKDKPSTISIDPGGNRQTANDKSPMNMQLDSIESLVADYKVGDIVRIYAPSDRPDKRLVGHQTDIAAITNINTSTVDLKIFGEEFKAVSLNDICRWDAPYPPVVAFSPSIKEMAQLLTMFDSKEDVIRAAIRSQGELVCGGAAAPVSAESRPEGGSLRDTETTFRAGSLEL